MKKKIIGMFVCTLLFATLVPMTVTADESGPILDIQIQRGFQFVGPSFVVKNIGDERAHNVTLTDIAVDGDVLYNNRDLKLTNEFNPGGWNVYYINSYFIGYGAFSMVLTVTCDEGTFYSDKTNGFIIGPFMIIL